MLSQVLSVRRRQARNPFSPDNKLFQDHARNGMKVAEINDRFRYGNRRSDLGQEVPTEYQMASELIADDAPFQDALTYQLLSSVDGSHEHKVGFGLSQITSLC